MVRGFVGWWFPRGLKNLGNFWCYREGRRGVVGGAGREGAKGPYQVFFCTFFQPFHDIYGRGIISERIPVDLDEISSYSSFFEHKEVPEFLMGPTLIAYLVTSTQ